MTGKRGPAGKPGKDGAAGKPGKQGKDGSPGDPGLPGMRGPPGPQGELGKKGKAGKQGKSGKPGQSGPRGKSGAPGPTGKNAPGAKQPKKSAISGLVKGISMDADTGAPLGGVKVTMVKVLKGKAAGSSSDVTADKKGRYQAFLPVGTYKVTFSYPGYLALDRTVNVGAGTTSTPAAMLVMKKHAAERTIFVLSWDDKSARLDAQLTTPGSCKVSFMKKNCKSAAGAAQLDVDLGSGTGPNTISVRKRETGMYYFTVKAYDGANLQASGARVDVYSNSKRTTFKVGINGKLRGDRWRVLSMDGSNGSLHAINA